MHGLINRAIQQHIVSKYGHDRWRRVTHRAGWDGGGFTGERIFEDTITMQLAQAASEELSIPLPALLDAVGEYWMRFTVAEGFEDMIAMLGDTFEEFLANLGDMHVRIALAFPGLRPPSLTLESSSEDSWTLRYCSHRHGFAPMVVGILRVLAERFHLTVEVNFQEAEAPQGEFCALYHIARVKSDELEAA